MVHYFIGVYLTKRTLRGCLKIQTFLLMQKNISTVCCHVIHVFSIYFAVTLICCYFCAKKSFFHVQKLDRCVGFVVSRMSG